jgi:hypothetical protein
MVVESDTDGGEATDFERLKLGKGCVRTADFPVACHIAAKVSRSRKFCYALALYRLSQRIHANILMDLEPRYYPNPHRSPYPIDHARFAYAIVTAYAVLEQLGLNLTGEAFKNRKWIPSVRQELESRLRDAGVDLNETVLWNLRGGKTNLEKSRPPSVLRKAEWAFGMVRDCEVEVVDAIADTRWLRSGVSAHKMSELSELLSIFDVANAQHLARRLLLDSMSMAPEYIPAPCAGAAGCLASEGYSPPSSEERTATPKRLPKHRHVFDDIQAAGLGAASCRLFSFRGEAERGASQTALAMPFALRESN